MKINAYHIHHNGNTLSVNSKQNNKYKNIDSPEYRLFY